MTRRALPGAVALLLASLLARAAAPVAAPPAEPLPAGATIVGDSDAAIGLYLTPWKDEEPLPPGRNPSNFTVEAAPADAAADRARIEGLDSIDGYRRAHRHSYGN
ncbi:MAG: hypothetical protein C0434_03580 [Xanthomonadaceae bacterium]|nr:hypothetical protein [Xanthomonadaceae bacterium]